MIPLSLRLNNFMSYHELEPPLNFGGFQIACLSGRNGEGKSALFDGITWSLWGRARGVDERGTGTDELITEGQNQMQVEFVFELEQNTYRVIRSRSKRKQTTRLEFQIKSNGHFSPLTGNSIRETQGKINQLLRLDYRTFINSAFILQGKADSFLNLKATERKEILAEILNLGIYDRLEESAREAKRELEKRYGALQTEVDMLDHEIEHEAKHKSDLTRVEHDLAELREELGRKEERLNQLKLEQAKVDGQRKLLQELEGGIGQTKNEIDRLSEELIENQANLEKLRFYLERSDKIRNGHGELQKLRAQEEDLARKAPRFRELQNKLRLSETEIASRMGQLETEISNLNKRQSELAAEEQTEQSLKARRAELQKAAETLKKLEKERDSLREDYQDCQTKITGLKSANERRAEKVNSAGEKLSMLEKEVKPNCPLCDQELSSHNRERLIQDFKREIEAEKKELEQNKIQLKELEETMDRLRAEGTKIAAEIESKQDIQTALGEIDSRIRLLQANRQKLINVEAKLAEYTAMLKNNKFAPEAFRKKDSVNQELAVLRFDPESYEAVRLKIKDLQFLDEEKMRLEQAQTDQAKLTRSCKHLQSQLDEKERFLRDDRLKAEKIKGEISKAMIKIKTPDLFDSALRESEADYLVSKKQEDELLSQRAVLKENLKRCQTARERLAELSMEQEKVLKETAIYADLIVAFGKKGIQALIIENAVPEIEEEANKVLGKLTEDNMSLSFLTQKNQKTGGVVETLDLAVSDEQGRTRKYELFSGGEAFRINFAVRIALSKLLARRAGARLETLVIDEGFGTQDTEGKEKLIEAISAIKSDFKKILVITHLDDLKEMFPARIEVSKKPGIGSTAIIV